MGSDGPIFSFASLSFSKERGGMMKGQRSAVQRWRFILVGSGRVKMFVAFCILFLCVFVVSRAAQIMGWRHQQMRPLYPSDRQGYTILMNTWRRNDLLKKSVAHYSKCKSVDAIRVIWSEKDPPPETLRLKLLESVQVNEYSHKIEFRFNVMEEDDLNNRFRPVDDLRTDAVFSIDDDVVVPCETLEFAFSVWRNAPDSMVGFVPRMHWLETTVLWACKMANTEETSFLLKHGRFVLSVYGKPFTIQSPSILSGLGYGHYAILHD